MTHSFRRTKFRAGLDEDYCRAIALSLPRQPILPFGPVYRLPEVWEVADFGIMDLPSFLRRRFQAASTLFLKHLSNSKRTRK